MKRTKQKRLPLARASGRVDAKRLLGEIRELIQRGREHVAQTVDVGLVATYWSVGERIRREVLKSRRAEYGEQIVPTLSAQLVPQYGEGFSKRNLFRMIRFAEVLPDHRIVATLSAQLGWTHFRHIIPLAREQLARRGPE